jgi:UDP-N-acetylglucosamine 1-carboxyvinyltransferase
VSSFFIEGGRRLSGTARISGAKNSALKLMAASLMGTGVTVLENVPRIGDVFTMMEVLERLGADCRLDGDVLSIDTSGELSSEAPYDLVRRMRASINVLGPLVARRGHARVALPGGCNIGTRGLNLHERGLEQLGVLFHPNHGYLEALAPELVGKRIVLEFPSRGATENILTAGVLAKGTTVIDNAAREPDIADLAAFLNGMGARINGAGTSTIEIEGLGRDGALGSTTFRVSADPIEAGTLALGVLSTQGDAELVGAKAGDLEIFLEKVAATGASWAATPGGVRVSIDHRPRPVDVVTLPYPGFPTDLQAPMMAYLATADGTSIVTENVFEARFLHVGELVRMGANIRTEGHHAVVAGVRRLEAAPVRAMDLRGGAALVVAALGAEGRTEIQDIQHVERGYEDLLAKLAGLGASVEHVHVLDAAEAAAETN